MSKERVSVDRLQELVRLHRLQTACHERARLLRMGPNTERAYREAIADAGLLEGSPDELPEREALHAAVLRHRPPKSAPQERSSAEKWAVTIEQMHNRGAQPKAIYDALRLELKGDFTASLWAVKRFCRQLARQAGPSPEDVAIRVTTAPGEVAQVDFGYAGEIYDPETGQVRRAWLFVMTLAYSRHQFARLVFDQRTETWLRLHIEAFEAFGGVVETVVPDNLKAAVLRAAFAPTESPALNRSYRELAQHYGFKIDPTPPRAPKKKGKVERGVQYGKRNFIKPRTFVDLADANRELDEWVVEIAGKRIHGTTGRRPLDVFEAEERPALKALPHKPFRPVVWKQAKIHQDCHFVFEKRTYPVPWRFIGKQVWIRATPRSLEVYCDDVRVITHERGVPVPDSLLDRCLPEHRAAWRHRGRGYWLERADALGAEVGAYIREVFDSDPALSMLRAVQAMVTHLETFPVERARAACRRASYFGNYGYVGLRDILRRGLDLEPLPVAVAPARGHLDAPRYARRVHELLQLPLEVTDEPN